MVGPMVAKMGQIGPGNRRLLWWRRWAKKDWAIAAVGFTAIAFALTLLSNSLRDEADSEISRPFLPNAAAFDLVDLTLLRNAKDRGFVWTGLPLATISGSDSDPAPTVGCFTLRVEVGAIRLNRVLGAKILY